MVVISVKVAHFQALPPVWCAVLCRFSGTIDYTEFLAATLDRHREPGQVIHFNSRNGQGLLPGVVEASLLEKRKRGLNSKQRT